MQNKIAKCKTTKITKFIRYFGADDSSNMNLIQWGGLKTFSFFENIKRYKRNKNLYTQLYSICNKDMENSRVLSSSYWASAKHLNFDYIGIQGMKLCTLASSSTSS